jgi:HAD superfamily hydrolase (TIGR01450 family)
MADSGKRMRSASVSDEVLERLHSVRGFVFDVDGTLVLGDHRSHGLKPLPGAVELTAWLTRQQIPFVLYTNGTARAPDDYARTLQELGFTLTEQSFLTPASTAVDVFIQRGFKRVLTLGGDGLNKPLRAAGIDVVAATGKPSADAVLIGWFREFTMDHLEAACHAVWNGAQVFSASQAMFFASAEGRSLGTSRAIAAMIKDITGCRIHVVGKPSLQALSSAGRRLKARIRDLAVVGDDPILEVPMAHRGHALAIAVNTGLGTVGAFAELPTNRQPHLIVHGVDELLTLLSANQRS